MDEEEVKSQECRTVVYQSLTVFVKASVLWDKI